MLISIIIPMYNVSKYIEHCIESCENQDIKKTEFELIVINDGSNDNSLDIAMRLQGKYPNITVVSQENSGLSMARNKGLDYAQGEYIWFVDSDDIIKENCLKSIVERCQKDDLDLLAICAANMLKGRHQRRFEYGFKEIVKGTDMLDKMLIQQCSPFTIYRKSFLDRFCLRFYPQIFHEDAEFSPRVYFFAERVGVTDDILYFVRQTPGSITRSANPKRAFDYIKICDLLNSFYIESADSSHSRFFHYQISFLINNALFLVCENKENFSKQLYQKRNLFSHMIKSHILKYKIEGVLFSLFPKNVLSIFGLLSKFSNKK